MDEHLWLQIFNRLPIETLCRFRCVCKWFNSLISSPFFIDLHHSFPRSATPPHLKPYLHVDYWGFPVDIRFPDTVEHSGQPLHFPFRAFRLFAFLGVIHGVACFAYDLSSDFSIILWNPTIHKYVALSCPKMPDHTYSLAFGYDTSRKDFKVVVVQIEHWTYTLYSNRQESWSVARDVKFNSSWHTPDGIEPKVTSWDFKHETPCFVNGTIHWVLSLEYTDNGDDYYIVNHSMLMFDCEREEFRRMIIPANLHSTGPIDLTLFEYAGLLAALVTTYLNFNFEVWVMEEHGVATSWKMLYMIPPNDPIVIHDPSFEELASYDPSNPWNMIRDEYPFSRGILGNHVFDESMLLMDHPAAQSYTNQERVTIIEDH